LNVVIGGIFNAFVEISRVFVGIAASRIVGVFSNLSKKFCQNMARYF
jgi:hypothetical protein